jgi:hypothetical protein
MSDLLPFLAYAWLIAFVAGCVIEAVKYLLEPRDRDDEERAR